MAGGFGSAVLEALAQRGTDMRHVHQAAVPLELIPHASREEQLAICGLDAGGLAASVRRLLATR